MDLKAETNNFTQGDSVKEEGHMWSLSKWKYHGEARKDQQPINHLMNDEAETGITVQSKEHQSFNSAWSTFVLLQGISLINYP